MEGKILHKLEDIDPHLKHLYTFNPYSEHFFGEEEKKEQNVDPELSKKLHEELVWTKQVGIIQIGTITNDPYQRCEKDLKIIHKCLDIIGMHKFPVHIITKSELILKDSDVIKKIQKNNWCHVSLSLSTIDKKLAKILEPNAPEPNARIKIVKKLNDLGISAGILFTYLPYISDNEEEIEELFIQCEKNSIKIIIDEPLHIYEEIRNYFFTLIKETPRLRKFLKRYERCYKESETPQLRFIRAINKIMFDLSMKHNISRNIPEYQGEVQSHLE
jgi:DNA repair photolyase